MALQGNASYFLSAANPTPNDVPDVTATPQSSASLGFGEEDAKRILQALQGGPLKLADLSARLGLPLPQVDSAIAYLNEAGMLRGETEGQVALSPFAQDAVKILAAS